MKKVTAGVLTMCMLVSGVPLPAFATVIYQDKNISVSESTDALKNAIVNVKSKIEVPEELTEFTYKYVNNNYTKVPYWNLNWRDKDYNASISVRCDDNGNILYYRAYDSEEERAVPKYLKAELKDKAFETIKSLAPNIANNVEFEEATFNGVYDGAYTYKFVRVENGYKMPDNTVNVSLKYDTGSLSNFSVTWEYDCEIPEAEVNISEEDAKAKVGENVEMKLSYRSKTEEKDGKKVTKAYLVYTPDKTYVAVDAKTGEVYETRDEYYDMSELKNEAAFSTVNEAQMLDSAAGGVNLTEKEIEKIDELKGLISKENAIKVVTGETSLFIDESAKAVEATLYQNYDYLNKENKDYIWRISLYDPRDVDYSSKDTYRANIDATVDAKTGKILSFYASVPGYYDKEDEEWKTVNVKYSKDECQNILEKFIKKTEPEKFKNTKLSDADEGYVLKISDDEGSNFKYVYGGYDYNYARYNEGIEYSYNNISGSVDGVTGKIYSYSANWTDDITFESPKNILTEREAYNAYVNNDGFELVYEINNKHYIDNNRESDKYYDASELYVLQKEARLVYRTNVSPACVSPFTGKLLNYNGEVYEEEAKKEYTDISGFWAERDIKLITDMGVPFEGNEFLPNKEITEEEFNDILNKLGYYYKYNDEEKELRETITKLDGIKIIIENLGLTKVAELEDIYKVDFSDANSVTSKDMGYIALAKGCGIINGDNLNNINPNKNISRAEAVTMAVKLINCGINR